MKLSESWLREWVNPSLSREQIGEALTMAGLEVEGIYPATEGIEISEVETENSKLSKDVYESLKESTDHIFEISITPNRGDCLSTKGLAQEISAITNAPLTPLIINEIPAQISDQLTIMLDAPRECPHYVGRIIKDINNTTATPIKYKERLFQAGIRSISLVVDIMNYVMLELGQPMHAFSLNKISKNIFVRFPKENEKIKLLDDREVNLNSDALIIADEKTPLAIAGIMGGLDSSVTLETKDVFLESAYFLPNCIAKTCRSYNMISESAYRFERGVDITLQRSAIERATQLIIEIAGGKPGNIIESTDKNLLPKPNDITLRKKRVTQLLGCEISDTQIENIFTRLGFAINKTDEGWQVTVPQRRSDISLEEDLIEEIARVYGYDNIPTTKTIASLKIHPIAENKISQRTIQKLFADLGYHEVVTYSFVDKEHINLFSAETNFQELLNPISAEMNVMRTSLMPGLVNVLLYNQNRQATRVRIFEIGLRFVTENGELTQKKTLAGLISGSALPKQWSQAQREVDFYDLKGDLDQLFGLTFAGKEFKFTPTTHVALHPGQAANISINNFPIGIIGALHPNILSKFKIDGKVFVFELDYDQLEKAKLPKYNPISKFPEIRRDIAIIISHGIPSEDISDTIRDVAKELLKDLDIFDVYQGKGIDPERKSIALSLTLQHASRTLVDEEVVGLMDRVIVALKNRFNAELRG